MVKNFLNRKIFPYSQKYRKGDLEAFYSVNAFVQRNQYNDQNTRATDREHSYKIRFQRDKACFTHSCSQTKIQQCGIQIVNNF